MHFFDIPAFEGKVILLPGINSRFYESRLPEQVTFCCSPPQEVRKGKY